MVNAPIKFRISIANIHLARGMLEPTINRVWMNRLVDLSMKPGDRTAVLMERNSESGSFLWE